MEEIGVTWKRSLMGWNDPREAEEKEERNGERKRIILIDKKDLNAAS